MELPRQYQNYFTVKDPTVQVVREQKRLSQQLFSVPPQVSLSAKWQYSSNHRKLINILKVKQNTTIFLYGSFSILQGPEKAVSFKYFS